MITEKQKSKRIELIKRHGQPIREYENNLLSCYFMEYSFSLIGIEQDGYSHT